MLVERADIDTADDGVCVKGTTGNAHVVNVTVRASRVRSRSSAVKFGSACGVAMRNLLFEDLHIRDSNRGLALQARDGGAIADVVFRRIVIDGTRWWPRNWWGDGGALYLSTMLRDAGDPGCTVTNVTFEDVVAVSQGASVLSGVAPGRALSGVTLRNVTLVLDRLPGWNYSVDTNPAVFPNVEYDPTSVVSPTRRNMTGWMPGLYVEGVGGLTLDGVNVTFVAARRQSYWGHVCVNTTAAGAPVTVVGGSCTPPP